MYHHHKAQASAEDVQKIVQKIGPLLDGENLQHILLACLFIVFVIQNPDISRDDLAEGVKGASEWVAMFLDSKEAQAEAEATDTPLTLN